MESLEKAVTRPPSSYPEWLACFAYLRGSIPLDRQATELMKSGTFVCTGVMAAAFQEQLVATINAMLTGRIRRFIRELNLAIELNEFEDICRLFVRLSSAANGCLFFESLSFLSEAFRQQLSDSVKRQFRKCWDTAVAFLERQSAEHPDADLDDALFQIQRVKLF